ncbi:hypothetical protein LTR84_005823 [Exophiala bonariae]|uniref:SnoaL-like domain-containing protein n=1 Tax=Exophiala bonariae TaxID=1690606 RepID=A0AAV9N5J5_9EURO|nr:hypothetical protein LTR84_005823 [Exophiala bonariae]
MASRPTTEAVQKLIQARSSALEEAFGKIDIEQVMSWQSKDVSFDDVALNKFGMDYCTLKAMFAENFGLMSSLKIIKSTTTGVTPEFVTWEMEIEVSYKQDEPALGIQKGQVTLLKGVAIQWWRWEGEGDKWSGDLSTPSLKGWKVLKENDYFIPVSG